MLKPNPLASIKGIVFKNNDANPEVLLLRNEREEWELPGGKMEDDETPEACLVREFKEETGLEVSVGPCAGSGILTILPPHLPSVTTVWISAYGCHLKSASPDQILISNEHQGWGWIPVADLGGMADVPDIYKTSILNWARSSRVLSPDGV